MMSAKDDYNKAYSAIRWHWRDLSEVEDELELERLTDDFWQSVMPLREQAYQSLMMRGREFRAIRRRIKFDSLRWRKYPQLMIQRLRSEVK